MLFKKKMKARYKQMGKDAFERGEDLSDNPFIFKEGYLIRTKIKWWEFGWKEAHEDFQNSDEE